MNRSTTGPTGRNRLDRNRLGDYYPTVWQVEKRGRELGRNHFNEGCCLASHEGVSPPLAPAPEDAQLIDAWRGGNEAAAAELVHRHARALARFLSAAGAGDDVEDLVQETFFRAFRKIDSFRGGSSFRTWVMAIGSNALKDVRRRAKRRPVVALEDQDVADERFDPLGEVVGRDLEARVQSCIEQLPTMQRDVFLLRAQQGLEYEDIASALDTTVGAARVHYHHAVKRIRQQLEERTEG